MTPDLTGKRLNLPSSKPSSLGLLTWGDILWSAERNFIGRSRQGIYTLDVMGAVAKTYKEEGFGLTRNQRLFKGRNHLPSNWVAVEELNQSGHNRNTYIYIYIHVYTTISST